jgi:hypothetical protein
VSTEREIAVAKSLGRMSGADLSRLIDFISYRADAQFNLTTNSRYWIMRQVVDYIAKHQGESP